MNIAAVMAALDIDDLGHAAKHAVQVIACRADRHTGAVTVSVVRVGTDMGVDRDTARLALADAVGGGYLAVDKPPGKTPTWQLTPLVFRGVDGPSPRGESAGYPADSQVRPPQESAGEGERLRRSTGRVPPAPARPRAREGAPVAVDNVNTGDSVQPPEAPPKAPPKAHPKAAQLTARLAVVCTGKRRATVELEAHQLVTWALARLDWRAVDMVIGQVEGWDRPPTLPRAVAAAFAATAADANVALPPFNPERSRPAQTDREPVAVGELLADWVATNGRQP
jgi:hypothetical protein